MKRFSIFLFVITTLTAAGEHIGCRPCSHKFMLYPRVSFKYEYNCSRPDYIGFFTLNGEIRKELKSESKSWDYGRKACAWKQVNAFSLILGIPLAGAGIATTIAEPDWGYITLLCSLPFITSYIISRNRLRYNLQKAFYVYNNSHRIDFANCDPSRITEEGSLLLEAYKKGSIARLDTFFSDWRHELAPIEKKDLSRMNDTLRLIYRIYNDFMAKQNYIDNSDYLILPHSMQVTILSKATHSDMDLYFSVLDKQFHKRININDFRPYIEAEDVKSVYLSKKYIDILNNFLDYRPVLEKEYLFDYTNKDRRPIEPSSFSDIIRRYEFLAERMTFSPFPSSLGFAYLSFPLITKIILNSAFSYARISFRSSQDSWGEAQYDIIDGELKNFRITNNRWAEQ